MKKLLINYFNTDTKQKAIGLFDSDDIRLTDNSFKLKYTDVIGEAINTKENVIAENGFMARVYICKGVEYLVFSDNSALQK